MKKNNIIMLVLGLLLAGSVAYNMVTENKNGALKEQMNNGVLKQDSILSTKLLLQKELDGTRADLEKYKGKTAEMDAMLKQAESELKIREDRINVLVKANSSVTKLKKELASLKKLRLNCDERVAILLKEKEGLKVELAAMNNSNIMLMAANEDLSNKLEWARQLTAQIVSVKYYKLKKSGPVETAKLKKACRVGVSVEIKENPLAAAGSRNLYLVVKGPDSKIIGCGKSFYSEKTQNQMAYSSLKEVDYKNETTTVKINYDFATKPAKGIYKFEVYIDGKYAGKTEVAFNEQGLPVGI